MVRKRAEPFGAANTTQLQEFDGGADRGGQTSTSSMPQKECGQGERYQGEVDAGRHSISHPRGGIASMQYPGYSVRSHCPGRDISQTRGMMASPRYDTSSAGYKGHERGGSQPSGRMSLPQCGGCHGVNNVQEVQPHGMQFQQPDRAMVEGSRCSGPSSASPELYQATFASKQPSVFLKGPTSKAMRLPSRPGIGKIGTKCLVKANHFLAELQDKEIYQYDVSITPEGNSLDVNRAIMNNLVKLYRESDLRKRLPAYDGRKSIYTAGPLPFTSRSFSVTLNEEEAETSAHRSERQFRVTVQEAGRADLHHLRLFLQGRQSDSPQHAVQALDIILRQIPTAKYFPVGRSFYSPDLGGRKSLGEGLESWRGFYQSIRPTSMGLSLNLDMSATAFFEPLVVTEFVKKLLNRNDLSRTLSYAECVKIKKALSNVKVEVTHQKNMRRKYSIHGLTPEATRELSFLMDGVTMKPIIDFFQETYGYRIQHTALPCLQVGSTYRPIYLPMEVCKIVKGQRYSKRLNEKQITALLKMSCQRPDIQEKDILQTVKRNAYGSDPYAEEFGLKISDTLASVEARILPPPRLKYNDSGVQKDCLPEVGQWNTFNQKLVNGGSVNNWICIDFTSNGQEYGIRQFCNGIVETCKKLGMVFNPRPVLPLGHARGQVEIVLRNWYRDCMAILKPQGKELDLLIAIIPDKNDSLYGDLKRLCETDLGIISQCCLSKHVFNTSPRYTRNLALKINVKVGGRNTVLVDALSRQLPFVSDCPTIIFGADVTHPARGEDSKTSIAAVVASQDWPEVTKYVGLVSAQPRRQEFIVDMYKEWQDPVHGTMKGGMIMDLLRSFYKATGRKPERIIFYRDGVSDSQYLQVLLYEVDAIRKACASMEENYQPSVTFIVVQKLHHTRLFANDHADRGSVDRSGNILPGTVVDTKICHPTEFDFYLCSHAGIQGTTRPAHYHVLLDENKFTADGLQSLTYNLCYTYARCTRSLSIVPPAHYAHLAAYRARSYMDPDQDFDATVRPLPALKDNIKEVIFYC